MSTLVIETGSQGSLVSNSKASCNAGGYAGNSQLTRIFQFTLPRLQLTPPSSQFQEMPTMDSKASQVDAGSVLNDGSDMKMRMHHNSVTFETIGEKNRDETNEFIWGSENNTSVGNSTSDNCINQSTKVTSMRTIKDTLINEAQSDQKNLTTRTKEAFQGDSQNAPPVVTKSMLEVNNVTGNCSDSGVSDVASSSGEESDSGTSALSQLPSHDSLLQQIANTTKDEDLYELLEHFRQTNEQQLHDGDQIFNSNSFPPENSIVESQEDCDESCRKQSLSSADKNTGCPNITSNSPGSEIQSPLRDAKVISSEDLLQEPVRDTQINQSYETLSEAEETYSSSTNNIKLIPDKSLSNIENTSVIDDVCHRRNDSDIHENSEGNIGNDNTEDTTDQHHQIISTNRRGSLFKLLKNQYKKRLCRGVGCRSAEEKARNNDSSPDNDATQTVDAVGANLSADCQARLSARDNAADNCQADEGAAAEPTMTHLQKLAFRSLHLSAPASCVLLHQRRQSWVQLSGHPGSLAPAGPGTIWKKRAKEPNETQVYNKLMRDPAKAIVPTFFKEIQYSDDHFIEMQDLLYTFSKPSLMDVKMGTRTFLEDEVANTKPREDLYEKMMAVSPDEPTEEERAIRAVTKRRYMEFRDNLSSSRQIGFRIEAMKVNGSPKDADMKKVRSREEVVAAMLSFTSGRESVRKNILAKLQQLKHKFEKSPFFRSHELIGSSILIVYDDEKAGAWIIDFAKTRPLPEGITVDHRSPWQLGNHEEGFLAGLDNIIEVMEEVKMNKGRRLSFFRKIEETVKRFD